MQNLSLKSYVNEHKHQIEKQYRLGMNWLAQSEIRDQKGGYKSEYNPDSHQYRVWGDGEDCILNTAGAILAFLQDPRYVDQARKSANHLVDSLREPVGMLGVTLPAGSGSTLIFPNYVAWAITALCETFKATSEPNLLVAASKLANWLSSNPQFQDGRILDLLRFNPSGAIGRIRDKFNESFSTWNSIIILALRETAMLTGDSSKYTPFERKMTTWLEKSQLRNGAISSQLWSGESAVYQALVRGRLNLLRSRWDNRIHPTSAVLCLQAFTLLSLRNRARILADWLSKAVGEGGLFFQYYWEGGHSIEEDVMPTALYSKFLLEQGFPAAEEVTIHTIQAILRSQIESYDTNANGGIKGLPGHPTLGGSAFAWDTAHALILLSHAMRLAD